MREMMQKLNIVKYAMSEEEKKKLMKKGFVPVENAGSLSSDGQNQKTGSQPEPDQKKEKKSSQKNQQKSGQKTKKPDQKSQQKQVPESGQGAEETSKPEPQVEEQQAGDGNA